MANDITANPWNLNATGVVSNSYIYVKNILWLNGSGSLVIVDNNGKDIIRDVWSAETEHNYGQMQWVNGMNVTTIGGGEVLVVIHK
jgi:hypothetical protein